MSDSVTAPPTSLWELADQRAVRAALERLSVPPAAVRASLARQGLAFVEPGHPPPPEVDLARSARALVLRSADRAAWLGLAAGASGPGSLVPEALALLTHLGRLAQRLAVLYGLDPTNEAGKLAIGRALAQAFDLPTPAEGAWRLHLSDLASRSEASAWAPLARGLGGASLRRCAQQPWRWIPGLGALPTARARRRDLRDLGLRLATSLSRSAGFRFAEEALEVHPLSGPPARS